MITELNGRQIKPLISEEEIQSRVAELGAELSRDYEGKNALLVGILKGSFIFLSDLIRQINLDLEIDFIRVSSYRDSENPGNIDLKEDISSSMRGRDRIVVEDLFDTGATAEYIKSKILSTEPASLKTCALVSKLERRNFAIKPDYMGFEIEKGFIVGYGMDYDERARNLPGIYVLA